MATKKRIPVALLMKATYAESGDFYRAPSAATRGGSVRTRLAQMRNRITRDYDWNAVLPSLLITSLLQPLLHISIMHKED